MGHFWLDNLIERYNLEWDTNDFFARVAANFYADITDRRGLRHEWDRIDDGVRVEILEKWKKIANPFPFPLGSKT